MIKKHSKFLIILSSVIILTNIAAILLYVFSERKYVISGFNFALLILFILLLAIYRNFRIKLEYQQSKLDKKKKDFSAEIEANNERIKILWWFILFVFIINVVVNVIELLVN